MKAGKKGMKKDAIDKAKKPLVDTCQNTSRGVGGDITLESYYSTILLYVGGCCREAPLEG